FSPHIGTVRSQRPTISDAVGPVAVQMRQRFLNARFGDGNSGVPGQRTLHAKVLVCHQAQVTAERDADENNNNENDGQYTTLVLAISSFHQFSTHAIFTDPGWSRAVFTAEGLPF